MAGLGRLQPGEAGGAEFLDVEDDVVGGQRQHHGVGIAALGERRRGRHRRAGIAAHRLDHHGGVDAELLGLAAGEKTKIGAGDDDRRRRTVGVGHAQQGLLIGRALAHQRQELLRQGVARHRPEPGPGAAGQKNGNDRWSWGGHYSKNHSAIARLALPWLRIDS